MKQFSRACFRPIIVLMVRFVCVLLVSTANSSANTERPVVTVEELLRLDTEAALVAARRSVVGRLERPGPVSVSDNDTLLLAIYGVGKSLTAELLIDAEPHVFRATRSQPVLGRSRQYTLDRIAPPCVHLKKSGNPEVLCLGAIKP